MPRTAAEKITITVLTGRRPAYLQATLESLRRCQPELVRGAHVVAFVNGHDAVSVRFLKSLDWIDRLEARQSPDVLRIGPAYTRCAEFARRSGRPFWLHLEDDWRCTDATDGWVEGAVAILDGRSDVGQVRLRHVGERTLATHMVTHRPIRWRPASAYRRRGGVRFRVAQAHYTFNPSLVRTADARRWIPCSSEVDAMRKFNRTRMLTAQVHSGVFRHLGEKSLRRALGRAD